MAVAIMMATVMMVMMVSSIVMMMTKLQLADHEALSTEAPPVAWP